MASQISSQTPTNPFVESVKKKSSAKTPIANPDDKDLRANASESVHSIPVALEGSHNSTANDHGPVATDGKQPARAQLPARCRLVGDTTAQSHHSDAKEQASFAQVRPTRSSNRFDPFGVREEQGQVTSQFHGGDLLQLKTLTDQDEETYRSPTNNLQQIHQPRRHVSRLTDPSVSPAQDIRQSPRETSLQSARHEGLQGEQAFRASSIVHVGRLLEELRTPSSQRSLASSEAFPREQNNHDDHGRTYSVRRQGRQHVAKRSSSLPSSAQRPNTSSESQSELARAGVVHILQTNVAQAFNNYVNQTREHYQRQQRLYEREREDHQHCLRQLEEEREYSQRLLRQLEQEREYSQVRLYQEREYSQQLREQLEQAREGSQIDSQQERENRQDFPATFQVQSQQSRATAKIIPSEMEEPRVRLGASTEVLRKRPVLATSSQAESANIGGKPQAAQEMEEWQRNSHGTEGQPTKRACLEPRPRNTPAGRGTR